MPYNAPRIAYNAFNYKNSVISLPRQFECVIAKILQFYFLVYKVNTLQYNIELLGSSDPDKIKYIKQKEKDLLSVLNIRLALWADFGSLPTGQRISLFYFCKEKRKMGKSKTIHLQSDTLNLTQADLDLTREVVRNFSGVTECHRNFYVTVFENGRNRKVILKYSGGQLRQAKIEKIDEGEE